MYFDATVFSHCFSLVYKARSELAMATARTVAKGVPKALLYFNA